jgi:hypothetical protein
MWWSAAIPINVAALMGIAKKHGSTHPTKSAKAKLDA